MKRMSVMMFFAFFFCNVCCIAQESINNVKINWVSWDEAVKMQQADLKAYTDKISPFPPKKVFIDVYTSWCGWCKKMDASTFADPEVAAYMNEKFYPIKMDAEMKNTIAFNNHTFVNPNPAAERSTHELPASLLDYGLSFPSYVLMDENFHRMVIYQGYQQKESFMTILKFFGSNQYVTYKNYLEKQVKPPEQK